MAMALAMTMTIIYDERPGYIVATPDFKNPRSTIASYNWVEWNTFNDPLLNLWISFYFSVS